MKKDVQKIKNDIYSSERTVWKILGIFADLFYVSMLWFICSLLVITIGAASAAAYDTIVHCIRRKETGILARFLSTFKDVFKSAAICTLICEAALAAWGILMLYIPTLGDSGMVFPFLVNAVVLGIVALGITSWVFPVLSRFEMGASSAMAASLKLIFAHLPVTLLMILTLLLTAAACVIWLVPLLVLPGTLGFVHSIFVEKIFAQLSN